MNRKKIKTSHGIISFYNNEVINDQPVLVMIHGNSCSSSVFNKQFNSPLFSRIRIIMPDLLGHGYSSDAIEPHKSYCMEGYADALAELFKLLNLQNIVLVGWSLGGHIGLELLLRHPKINGLLIIGTPPVSKENLSQGFFITESVGLAGKANLTDDELFKLGRSISGDVFTKEFFSDIKRTDGQARELMFKKFAEGTGINQYELVMKSSIPIAVLNGKKDPFINIDFIDKIKFKNLWRNHQIIFEQSSHTPFWEESERFNNVLLDFYHDVNSD